MAILEIKNLSKIYRSEFLGRKKTALKGIDLTIEENEIFGYLGPNGAGKTTTIKSILSLIRMTTGTVRMFGKSFSEIELKQNIGYLPENPYFYTYLTAYETLDFYGQLFEIPKKTRQERIRILLNRVGLTDVHNEVLRHFSKGMMQRIGIAQALINNPQLIILDEPMSGLDPIGRKEVRDIIVELKSEGKTIFFSSHILSDVEMICDRVAMINKGEIVQIGNLEEMRSSQTVTIEIRAKNINADCLKLIEEYGHKTIISSDQILVIANNDDEADRVIQIINQQQGKIIAIVPNRATLEDLFMQKVREGNHEKN